MNTLEKSGGSWHINGIIAAQWRSLMLWVSRKAIICVMPWSEGRSAVMGQ